MTPKNSKEIRKYIGKITLKTAEKRIISGKIDVNFMDSKKNSLLKFALESHEEEFAKLLIKNGAKYNPEEIDESKDTIIMESVDNNCFEVVKYCVDLGYNINARIDILDPPLVSAAKNGNIEMCKYLLDKGADVDIQDGFSTAIISRLSAMSPALKLTDKYQEIIKLLFEYGADKHVADYEQKTPLTWAIERENLKLIELFCTNATPLDVEEYIDEIYDSIAKTSTGIYTIKLLEALSFNFKLEQSLPQKQEVLKIKI